MAWVVPAIAAVGEAAGTVGSALGSAAGAVGSTLGVPPRHSARSSVGRSRRGREVAEAAGAAAPEAAGLVAPTSTLGTVAQALQSVIPETGLGNLAQGLNTVFTGGPEAASGFVGPPSALAGPAVTGPGFVGGFFQGLTGQYAPSAAPSGGSAAGGGLGQLVSFLNQMHGQVKPAPRWDRSCGWGTCPWRRSRA